jgi:hypothetical protein
MTNQPPPKADRGLWPRGKPPTSRADSGLAIAGHRFQEAIMKTCDVCGNEYARCFEVTLAGQTYTFDSFECAVQRLAPTC